MMTSPTSIPRTAFTVTARDYALARMEIGPEDMTLHYGREALKHGAHADEVVAAMHRWLGTAYLRGRADAALMDVEIDANEVSIDIERAADRLMRSAA